MKNGDSLTVLKPNGANQWSNREAVNFVSEDEVGTEMKDLSLKRQLCHRETCFGFFYAHSNQEECT
eukprot:snap_masked-scaffold_21-processed-gene-3.23-mRNA-1 protein AED:1.00 eAED:1.00 QI:0/0/0/0/1/1/2/0/65